MNPMLIRCESVAGLRKGNNLPPEFVKAADSVVLTTLCLYVRRTNPETAELTQI